MAQHDYVINDQLAAAFRADLNAVLQAIVTLNSGTSFPTTTYANMLFYKTDTRQLWKRFPDNSGWSEIMVFNDSNVPGLDEGFPIFDAAFNAIGALSTHTLANWLAGTVTQFRMISPQLLRQTIEDRIDEYSGAVLSGWTPSWVFPGIWPHGLGALPGRYRVQLRAKTDFTAQGLAAGDVIDVTSRSPVWTKADATQMSVFSQTGATWTFPNSDSSSVIQGNQTNFDLRFTVWPETA